MADFESGINVVVAAALYLRLHSTTRRMKFDVLRKEAMMDIALDFQIPRGFLKYNFVLRRHLWLKTNFM